MIQDFQIGCRKVTVCKLCCAVIDSSSLGVSALNSHAKGNKHKQIISSRNTDRMLFFSKSSSAAKQSVPESSKQSTVRILVTGISSINAEIYWTLKVVNSHFLFRSCVGLNNLFRTMFHNSQIAKLFQPSKTKCSYLVNFSIAPQFRQELVDGTKQSPFISVSFGESLNDILQKEQMNVIIRFWNAIAEKIEVCYLDSKFLKRPNATDLLNELPEAMKSLTFSKKLIQLSMDGSNTNWEVFRLLKEHKAKKKSHHFFLWKLQLACSTWCVSNRKQ